MSRTLHDCCRFVDEGRAEEFAAPYTHDGVHDDRRSQRVVREQIKARGTCFNTVAPAHQCCARVQSPAARARDQDKRARVRLSHG